MELNNKQIEHIAFNLGTADWNIGGSQAIAADLSIPEIQSRFEDDNVPGQFSLEVMRRKVADQVKANWEDIQKHPAFCLDENCEAGIRAEIQEIMAMDDAALNVLELDVKARLAKSRKVLDEFLGR